MKTFIRRFFASTLAAIFILGLAPTAVYANDSIGVSIDGQEVIFDGQGPVIVDGRTLVPVRGVFEQLGFEVDWYGYNRQAILKSDDYLIIIIIDSAIFTANDVSHTLDVPVQIIGGSTMLPIRAVLESVGYYAEWDGGTGTILISSELVVVQEQMVPLIGDIPDYIAIRSVQYSTALTELDLSELGLTDEDIIPLRYMTNLEALLLRVNQITNITPLTDLTKLTYLDLRWNHISDITPLEGLTNLRELWLFNNYISDITPLAELTSLEWLSLWGNPITDRSPVAHVENITGRP